MNSVQTVSKPARRAPPAARLSTSRSRVSRDRAAAIHAAEPFAGLVRDLALIERRILRLREKDVVERLEEADGRLTANDLERQLWDQRTALCDLASHLPATTRDGAILQALIALEVELALTDAVPVEFRTSRNGQEFQANTMRLRRLLYSIVYADDDLGEDLQLLRDRMAPRGFYGIAQVQELDAGDPFEGVRA